MAKAPWIPRAIANGAELKAHVEGQTRELVGLFALMDAAVRKRFGPHVSIAVEPPELSSTNDCVRFALMASRPDKSPLSWRIVFTDDQYLLARTDNTVGEFRTQSPDELAARIIAAIREYFAPTSAN
ncbi:MAG: hypothetical protein WDN04_11305 [Rhodospirillales bacterium]